MRQEISFLSPPAHRVESRLNMQITYKSLYTLPEIICIIPSLSPLSIVINYWIRHHHRH